MTLHRLCQMFFALLTWPEVIFQEYSGVVKLLHLLGLSEPSEPAFWVTPEMGNKCREMENVYK